MIRSPLASSFPCIPASTANELDQLKYDFLIRTGELLHKYGNALPSARTGDDQDCTHFRGGECVFVHPDSIGRILGEGEKKRPL